MNWIYRAERKFGRFAIPNLMKYVMGLLIVGSIVGMVNPAIYFNFLAFDLGAVMHGQVWRLVTFIFYPMLSGGISGLFFFAIMIYLYYMIGNTLERVWGPFRFNLYFFSGIILTILSMVVYYLLVGDSAVRLQLDTNSYASISMMSYRVNLDQIFQAMFLTFAFMFPETEFLVFFIIPVKAKWLGFFYLAISGVSLVRGVIAGDYITVILIAVALLNFFLFYLVGKSPVPYMASGTRKVKSKVKKTKKRPETHYENGARHRCSICGKTELDDDSLEFRYCSKCEGNYEYCSEHLFTHEHVHKH